MKKIYKWRWSIVILLTIITVIGAIITFYFPIAILIAIGINELVAQIYRIIIVPRLKTSTNSSPASGLFDIL